MIEPVRKIVSQFGWADVIGAVLGEAFALYLSRSLEASHWALGWQIALHSGAILSGAFIVHLLWEGFANPRRERDEVKRKLKSTRKELSEAQEAVADARTEVEEIRQSRPEVVATLDTRPSQFGRGEKETVLRIYNSGATATFRANLRVLHAATGTGPRAGTVRKLWWSDAGGIEARIAAGGEDHLPLALHRYNVLRADPSVHDYSYSLLCYGNRMGQQGTLFNVAYVPEKSIETIVAFEVVVSAEPPTVEGPWRGQFVIDHRGVHWLEEYEA